MYDVHTNLLVEPEGSTRLPKGFTNKAGRKQMLPEWAWALAPGTITQLQFSTSTPTIVASTVHSHCHCSNYPLLLLLLLSIVAIVATVATQNCHCCYCCHSLLLLLLLLSLTAAIVAATKPSSANYHRHNTLQCCCHLCHLNTKSIGMHQRLLSSSYYLLCHQENVISVIIKVTAIRGYYHWFSSIVIHQSLILSHCYNHTRSLPNMVTAISKLVLYRSLSHIQSTIIKIIVNYQENCNEDHCQSHQMLLSSLSSLPCKGQHHIFNSLSLRTLLTVTAKHHYKHITLSIRYHCQSLHHKVDYCSYIKVTRSL